MQGATSANLANRVTLLTSAEFTVLMNIFKQALSADLIDACSRNKIRACVLVPLAAAAAVCRLYGRSEASMAFLRAVNHPIPQIWEMEAQAEGEQRHHVDCVSCGSVVPSNTHTPPLVLFSRCYCHWQRTPPTARPTSC